MWHTKMHHFIELAAFLCFCFVSVKAAGVLRQCGGSCYLPECYCKPYEIPRELDISATPQMVSFTFSGSLTEDIRRELASVFPDTIRNPNSCPMGITTFLRDEPETNDDIGDKTDYCQAHLMYIRGHEIAVAGPNYTIAARKALSKKAFIPYDELTGGRKETLGTVDSHLKLFESVSLTYDSSLIYDNINEPIWPFTLNAVLEPPSINFKCHKEECLKDTPVDLWEIPIVSLYSWQLLRYCPYLHTCGYSMKNDDEVFKLLMDNLNSRMTKNRAPMVVNLNLKAIRNQAIKKAVKRFLWEVTSPNYDHVWLVTVGEMLRWMQSPADTSAVHGMWSCNEMRKLSRNCTSLPKRNLNRSGKLSDLLDVGKLWIYQLILMVVLYIYLVQREKRMEEA